MRVLITGADGFVGKNLRVHLSERKDIEVALFTRENSIDDLLPLLENCDFIFHLAGVNRPQNVEEFKIGNSDLTAQLCDAVASTGKNIPIIYTSSIQAEVQNPYGESKASAEQTLINFSQSSNINVYIFRLPNVFGKWAKPNYNSAVATFCHNITRNLPIQINDPSVLIRLVYVDDVVSHFLKILDNTKTIDELNVSSYVVVSPEYQISVGELANTLQSFKNSRETKTIGSVGTGLVRALYSTYVSYLPTELFSYPLIKHEDPRGVFVEMLKTNESGQFSFFTAHPGVTRGGHYHHTKTEKFLVIKGSALFKFKHVLTGEYYELATDESVPTVVETVPGWNHDITNIGDNEMIVMLWANEIFDRQYPDTYARAM